MHHLLCKQLIWSELECLRNVNVEAFLMLADKTLFQKLRTIQFTEDRDQTCQTELENTSDVFIYQVETELMWFRFLL